MKKVLWLSLVFIVIYKLVVDFYYKLFIFYENFKIEINFWKKKLYNVKLFNL